MSNNPYQDNTTGVTKNKLGIMDAAELRDQEYQLTRIRLLELQFKPIAGNFDLDHLKAIHKHVFSDVYSWAGQEREINISKKSVTEPGYKTVFADKQDIAARSKQAFEATPSKEVLRSLNAKQFSESMTDLYAKWNKAHPFPEGNGRALQAMLGQLARETGHELAFRRMPGDIFVDAAETSLPRQAINNPRDQRPADLDELREIFEYITDPAKDATINLSTIKLNEYADHDRALVQQAVAEAVKADPESFIDAYRRHEEAHGGRYVAADLFKETFAEYSASNDSRNRYNNPVHNSAAVLSAELFKQNLEEHRDSDKQVVFLTGTPGAGKTSFVLAGGEIQADVAMVFEGQLSDPVTSIEKIQQVLDAGLVPAIRVVHVKPEFALANTLTRFEDKGRGASINVMASIQGGLPDSLEQIRKQYGDAVELTVIDKRLPKQLTIQTGWQHVELLKSEGQNEHIKSALSTALERRRSEGGLSDPAYKQAAGLPPVARSTALLRAATRGGEANEQRPGISGGNKSTNILKTAASRER